ncbi:hypothetical protein V1508DRAFT_19832 [Lipomyces doorenjongii]|uniref:uncharacterized protein n=1 Tax=Lipomyces doorenjongii TaxID=383834 RepID=UPI0034CF5EE8
MGGGYPCCTLNPLILYWSPNVVVAKTLACSPIYNIQDHMADDAKIFPSSVLPSFLSVFVGILIWLWARYEAAQKAVQIAFNMRSMSPVYSIRAVPASVIAVGLIDSDSAVSCRGPRPGAAHS